MLGHYLLYVEMTNPLSSQDQINGPLQARIKLQVSQQLQGFKQTWTGALYSRSTYATICSLGYQKDPGYSCPYSLQVEQR